jgi:hypothetical protein
MRIWSLHPKYLDAKGLVALWRETLLAKNVLQGKTKGYKNHPQLIRFKNAVDPLVAINLYLEEVYHESLERGYNFNKNKFTEIEGNQLKLSVTKGQIDYEWQHLLKKLKIRDLNRYEKLRNINKIEIHPIFFVIDGEIEDWEII